MEERRIKTHLIITDIHEKYHIEWCGKIADIKPKFINGKPLFIIISSESRVELNTTDMVELERRAKFITEPRGRGAVSTDTARIYIREENGHDKLLGRVIHDRVKTYAPMFDKVWYER